MSVIKEVPVFLSKSCMENLLLFEFPNRPKQQPIKESSVVDCKYKQRHQHAELSLALDTNSPNFERHRGQELGRLVPEQFQCGLYDRQLLRSQPCPPPGQRQRCAVARFHGNRLILCPLPGGRLVMQPSLEHLDAKQPGAAGEAAAAPAAEPEGVEAKAVTLRFARQETPEARQRREQGYRACQRMLDAEPWLRCRWLDGAEGCPDPLLAAAASTRPPGVGGDADVVAMETEEDKRLAVDEPGDYLSRLCPPVSSVSAVSDHPCVDHSPSVSLARLRAMPCEERLRALLKSACVLRWAQLVDLLKQCGMTHAQLTESLSQIQTHLADLACLVHGLWVVKSEVLYPAGTLSMHSGVPAEVLCRGRDYILCRFVQGRTVTRKEIASLVKMPSEEISQILIRISRIVRHTGDSQRAPKMRLAFVTEEDADYVRKNPDVVKKAQYYWEAKWKLLSEQLKLDKAARAFRTVSVSMDGAGGSRRSRTRSARYSHSSCDTASDSSLSSCSASATAAAAAASSSSPGGRSRRRRLYSRRQCVSMCEGEGEAAADAPAPSRSRSRTPSPSRTVAAAAAAAPAELESRLRRFLLAKLHDRLVARFDELLRFFRSEEAELPPAEEDCRRLFDSAASSVGLTVLNGGGGGGSRLYALASDSQSHPQHRRQLLAQLSAGGSQLTLAQLRARLDEAGLETLPDPALKALVKEYCQFRGKAYYAKGYDHGS